MKVRQRKKMIALAAALVALGGVGVLAGGLAVPVEAPAPASADAPAPSTAPSTAPATAPAERKTPSASLGELVRLCGRDLRRPLYDPPSKVAATARPKARAKPKPKLTLSLIGTAAEPGNSMAMFWTRDRKIKVCGEGDRLEDGGRTVTITRIEPGKVTVTHGGTTQTLTVPRR